jgi:uncharacterized protein (TIGR02466 family)
LLQDTQKKIDKIIWENNDFNYRSVESHLHKDPQFKELHDWFSECLTIVKRTINYQATTFKITQSWANRADKGQSHHLHKHPNSVISGIYYLSDSSSGTQFVVPDIWSPWIVREVQAQHFDFHIPENNQPVVDECPSEAGNLLIFPSILSHTVAPNQDQHSRYTISFNSFPSGEIGHFGFLSGLEIEVK